MGVDSLVHHQIAVQITSNQDKIILLLSDGQKINWPVKDITLSLGQAYLILSPDARLPSKEELAKQVLKEIFQGSQ